VAQPSSVEVARLLGIPNLLQAEITALDPGRNTSRLRCDDFELTGPYFPGRLLGDRVWLCMRAEELRAAPLENGGPGPNQVAVKLARIFERPQSVRLEFSRDITVDLTRAEFEQQKDNREWLVEFPARSLRVIG
jgi:hypothetical protein